MYFICGDLAAASDVFINTYLSSCMGLTYPADKMLSERILGSMMVSSDSGVLRRRPGTANKKNSVITLQTHCWRDVWFSGWEKGLDTKLTHNKLTDFFPVHVTSRFMHNSDSDSPLKALQRKKGECSCVQYIQNIPNIIFTKCNCCTWCRRNVPWHGIPPLWSTTAGM